MNSKGGFLLTSQWIISVEVRMTGPHLTQAACWHLGSKA